MDIRSVSQEEKDKAIKETIQFFEDIRYYLNSLEINMQKEEDLMTQASAVWISRNLCRWFHDFINEVRNIHTQKDKIQQQIMDAATENEHIKE